MAREALRAARRQAKAEAASGRAASARRTPPPAARRRRPGGADTADARARAVRDFAADAFRLPPETDPAGDATLRGETPAAGSPAGGPSGADWAAPYPERATSPDAGPVTEPTVAPNAGDTASAEGGATGSGQPGHAGRAAHTEGGAPGPGGPGHAVRTTSPESLPPGPGMPTPEHALHAVSPEGPPPGPGEPGHAGRAAHTEGGAPGPGGPGHAAPTTSPESLPLVPEWSGHAARTTSLESLPPGPEWPGHVSRAASLEGASPVPERSGHPPRSASSEGRVSGPEWPGHASRTASSEGPVSAHERSGRPRYPRDPAHPSAAGGREPHSAPVAQARAPRSMAAPGRDGDLRRTFPALPPRRAADEGLAGTWWGNAWVRALEEGALDVARLERGRGYAEGGHVDAITVTPGLVLAYVQGSRARPYRVQVRLRTLGDADWDRFLDAAVERPGHIAALLDKELPHSLADLADRGVPLLPGPGDLTPQCSCPDSGHPCKHAAALCYQTARLLDADPFVLLLLRGRGERALLDALSRRNAARAARAAQDRGPAPLPGLRAGEVLARRALPPLPAPLPAPPHPEQPPAYPAAPGGPDPFALDQLATDAAARAHALLTTGRDPVGTLTLWQDAVRLAAARPGSGLTAGTRALYASLASAAGRDTAELARAVAAWRQGGPQGLDVLEEPWDPPAGRFDRARPLLLAADLPAFRPWRNHLTHPRGHVQLRLGRSGLWYAYESEPGREDWWPRGTPDLDPVGALTGLGTRVDL
ncbi:SWIM zinc finger family protein [Streptomyces sp. OM5714]|uniref:SWIM zinc finger family protein n=1 Tax=Streptomyces sp. OM5714 TaxID=2602736 RepID=UPI001F09346E|nr:SWIM zinc finger family protein [Streptomyces sp. OM5714]